MKAPTFATLSLLSVVLVSAREELERRPRCDTHTSDADIEVMQLTPKLMLEEAEKLGTLDIFSNIFTVPVWFHVVSAAESGHVTNEALDAQFELMLSDFAPHNVSFSLEGITKTVNETWAAHRDSVGMKRVLRRGDYDTLNIYFLENYSGLGWCTFPWLEAPDDELYFWSDGCTVLSATVPGGTEPLYDMGKTAVHEVGHWLDVYHPFGASCACGGLFDDMVHDTPIQLGPVYGCPVNSDTCPDKPGLDPIQNIMGYGDDACLTEFTPGQAFRMHHAWYNIRTQVSSPFAPKN